MSTMTAPSHWVIYHKSFDLASGTFAVKTDAQLIAEMIHNALRRFYSGVSPSVVQIEGKKPAYSIMLPRVRTQWWPTQDDHNAIMHELYRVTLEFADVFERNNV